MKLIGPCVTALLAASILSPAPAGAVATSLGAGNISHATTAGGWTAHALPMLPGSGFSVSYVAAVGCPHAGLCVAMGLEGKDLRNAIPVIVTDTNGALHVMKSPVPADSTGNPGSIDYMACQADGRCTGIGLYPSPKGTRGWILSGSGNDWTATASPDVPSLDSTGIACPPSGDCVFAGTYFGIVTGHGSSWTQTEPPLPPEATASGTSSPREGLQTGACGVEGICVMVGAASWQTKVGGRGEPVIITGADSSWSAVRALLPPDAQTVPDAGVSLGETSCY
jgi:hypothetical protein